MRGGGLEADGMDAHRIKRRVRRQKLPLPGLQWKLIGAFVALSAVSMLLQYVLISTRLSQLIAVMPMGSEYFAGELPRTLLMILVLSLSVLLPTSAAIGVLITFRWAGPLQRFHIHLRQVAAGVDPGPCKLREKDELQELCQLLNQAIESARSGKPVLQRTEDDAKLAA